MNIIERSLAKFSFTGQKRIRIIRQIQRMMTANVQLTECLETLYNLESKNGKKPREPIALMIKEWQRGLGSGKTFAKSMHGWIDTAGEMIIEAGEDSDKLSLALEDAVQAQGAARKIRNTILGGMLYPIALFAALIFIFWGFGTKIAPTFATILPIDRWTGNPAIMYAISHVVVTWLPVFAMILAGIATAIGLSFPVLTGPVRKYLDYLPPWSIYKIIQGASFMMAMRGFLIAGVPVPEALRRMIKLGNPYFKERVIAILSRVNSGKNLGDAMKESGLNFPNDEISGEISVYAGLDGFSENLDLLAREWIEDSVQRTQNSIKLIQNLILVLVAITIGYMAASLFQLNAMVGQSVQR